MKENKQFYIRIVVTVVAIIVVMLVAKLLFFSGQERPVKSGVARIITPAVTETPNVINWQDAAKYYGEFCTVEGTIVATHNSGKACFLNFHPNWKKYFTAVIFANRFSSFPASPEDYYRGKKVRVTGYIKEYQGKPEIILESPVQIKVID